MTEPSGSRTESFLQNGVAETSGSREVLACYGLADATVTPDNTVGAPKPVM